MKLLKHTLIVVLIVLNVETQCGVIDSVFGKVKNTTDALKQDVSNVWNFSKNFVGLETPLDNKPEEEKRGLIGGILHNTKETVHNVYTYFWNTDVNSNDSGLFGNLYNRVKNKLSKVKGAILGKNTTPRPPSDNEKLIQQTLDRLFFGNGTRQVHGKAFQETINSLRKKLQEIKNEVKKGIETTTNHGEGLIDIRVAGINGENIINDNTPGVNNDVYDAVEENLNSVRDGSDRLFNNIKDKGDKVVTFVTNGVHNAAEQINVVRGKALDAATKENELLQNSYNYVNHKVGSSVKNTVDDAKRLTY